MERNIRPIIIAFIIFSIPYFSVGTQATNILLTEEVVTRYESTYPDIWKLTKKLEEIGKMKESDEKTKKTLEITAQREEILKAKGWTDLWEYLDTMARVQEALIPLLVLDKFTNTPEDRRKKAEEGVKEQLKNKEFSEEEITVMTKHFPMLKKMLQEAGNIPK